MTLQTGKQLQYTYCSISQEVKTINQVKKFDQLIEYNLNNIHEMGPRGPKHPTFED